MMVAFDRDAARDRIGWREARPVVARFETTAEKFAASSRWPSPKDARQSSRAEPRKLSKYVRRPHIPSDCDRELVVDGIGQEGQALPTVANRVHIVATDWRGGLNHVCVTDSWDAVSGRLNFNRHDCQSVEKAVSNWTWWHVFAVVFYGAFVLGMAILILSWAGFPAY